MSPKTDAPDLRDPDRIPDLAARLRRTALQHPDHPALIAGDRTVTYGELHARVDAVTGALQQLGVGPGDRVAIVLGTTVEFVETYAAVLRAGAAFVPLLPGLAPDELRHALADAEVEFVFVGPERAADIAALRGELPRLRHLVAVDVDVDDAHPYEQLLAEAGEPELVTRDAEDLAALVYTSGTTGRPRGAMLTRGNLAANQDQSLAGRFEVGGDDTVLLVLPLAHIYALNVGLGTSVSVGATMVLCPRFDPAETLDAIERHRVTVVLGAPPMYIAWLESGLLDRTDVSSVRLAVSGAAPLGTSTLERFAEATGITIEEGYGLTEASPSVSSTSMADAAIPGSVGLPLPGIDLRLVDAQGHDVEPGDPGEVWVRGPNVFQGYWNDPDATAAALTPDGWLRTGDVGIQDATGALRLVDRLRDLIIVSGFNVYPREVERVLAEDEAVAEAASVGAPHPLTGETVVAYVVPRTGHEVDVDALEARCRERLARYKCPSRIEVVPVLPHTATGKVRRGELRGRAGAP
ncbi:MAG: AMP-binding protein [Nitriliruptor sp.]|uniref:AMP-binding protein n=1 Tax=Nitriliruptor sp. TaxID=2448056 RepID=UPI0034A016AB